MASATGFSDIAPNATIYVNNLNEKIKKAPLKAALHGLFSSHGRIVDIVAQRGKGRGQAFIVFEDVGAATAALRELQGAPFLDKPMRIAFAKTKSDALAKKEGSFKPVEKRKRAAISGGDDDSMRPAAKRGPAAAPVAVQAFVPPPAPLAAVEPNKILLASNIPTEATEMMLRALFGQYAGLRDLRVIPERGLAFVEYDSQDLALPALQGLHNFHITPAHPMQVTFAKK